MYYYEQMDVMFVLEVWLSEYDKYLLNIIVSG